MSQTKTNSGWFLKALFVGDHEQNKSEHIWQILTAPCCQIMGFWWLWRRFCLIFCTSNRFFFEPSTGNSIEDAKLLEHLGTVALLKAFNSGPSDAEDAGVSENFKSDWSSCWNLVHNLNRYLHFGAGVHLLFPSSVGKHGVPENLSFPSRISQAAMLKDTGEYIIIYHLVMTNIAIEHRHL